MNEVLNQKQKDQETENSGNKEEHFNISELAQFLKCSKVSVHKYKKKGLPFSGLAGRSYLEKQKF